MTAIKVLPHHIENGKWPKVFRRLLAADRSRSDLLPVCESLEYINSEPVANSMIWRPIVEHAVIKYCSIFNSTNRERGGIGHFSSRDLFATDKALRFHDVLMKYRTFEIAHQTDMFSETALWVNTATREVSINGRQHTARFIEHFNPSTENLAELIQHIRITKNTLEEIVTNLWEKVHVFTKRQTESYLESLPNADLPISQPGQVVGLSVGEILKLSPEERNALILLLRNAFVPPDSTPPQS